MVVAQHLSSFGYELKIIRARNIDLKYSNGHLFVRCFLSAGNNDRVRLESREISSKSDLFWNQNFSLECLATQDSMNKLMEGSVVLELRWRTSVPVLGKIGGSRLLGRAEIPWKTVSESPEIEIEKWVVVMAAKSRGADEDAKPPALQVAMKVRVPAAAETAAGRRRRRRGLTNWEECGCTDGGCTCKDYDRVFAGAAALDAL
ncbi:hypothetical protein U1Q18_011261 [Sarracenia purpurea var. burkii]